MEDTNPLPLISTELDLMDDFLMSVWVESPCYADLLASPAFSPLIEIQGEEQAEEMPFLSPNPSEKEIQIDDKQESINLNNLKDMAESFSHSIPISLQERLTYALNRIRETQACGNLLVQVWVPVKMGERCLLSTFGQPFILDQSCHNLIQYRTVSTNYQFAAEKNSIDAAGLPGRVFVGRVPEWTPDVQYFASHEYPRVSHAQRCNVRGTIALPIFETNSHLCLGVVELVSTVGKLNYHSDVESICNALQAVNLKISDDYSITHFKAKNDSYMAALPEILEVLKVVCEKHRLPLAQTWIPCVQQGKRGCRHSEENYQDCVSTIDEACYVNDPSMLGFHEACSEHHLFRGQGISGKAFTTNQPCFSPDVTSFSRMEYPLSHHAKLFDLRAAVSIRLRSNLAGATDFVLEFFLPVSFIEPEEQKLIFDSLSITLQQASRSLRPISTKELDEENLLHVSASILKYDSDVKSLEAPVARFVATEPSCSTGVIEVDRVTSSSSCISLPMELNDESEELIFSGQRHQTEVVISAGKFTELKQYEKGLVDGVTDNEYNFANEHATSDFGKADEKKQTKIEKTVSMQVLRQYFAGSLKDAAKSIGVCPTTLKRICRQHGITRWPSRKIKKVGHSLRKLQGVIDSVQGGEGCFQFNSPYDNLAKSLGLHKKLSERNILSQVDSSEFLNECQKQKGSCSPYVLSSNSTSSSCSQGSSSSLGDSTSCSTQFDHSLQLQIKQEATMDEGQISRLKRPDNHLKLTTSAREPPKSLMSSGHQILLKVKAIYGDEMIRLKLQPHWGLMDLKQEIASRFSISDTNLMTLKYLDDDSEWVLLTCDADLEECVDIYRSAGAHTVKVSVQFNAKN